MSIEAIGAVTSTTGTDPLAPTTPTTTTHGLFDVNLGSAIDSLQAAQSTAAELAVRAVTGDLDDVHDYTIAAAQASTMLELTAAVRNRAVESFNEIMRMQA